MAIRDRVTVTTKLGEKIVLVATRPGGLVEWNRGREWTEVQELAPDKDHTVIREAQIQTSELVSIVWDHEPRAEAAPRRSARKARAES